MAPDYARIQGWRDTRAALFEMVNPVIYARLPVFPQ